MMLEVPMKTPAAEAMEYMLDQKRAWEGTVTDDGRAEKYDLATKALALLDQVQSGKCKVLEREPTREMMPRGLSVLDCTSLYVVERLKNLSDIYKAMWDAAPSAAEVGE